MTTFAFDIETVANDRAHTVTAAKEFKAPANWKDPDKIKTYIEEARAKSLVDSAKNWTTGRIIAIGIYGDEGEAMFHGDNEKKVLTDAFKWIADREPGLSLVGQFSNKFDYPFVRGRAAVNGIGCPHVFHSRGRLKDLCDVFGYGNGTQFSKLSEYAAAFGLQDKLGSGADVAVWYEQRMWDTITEYCMHDCKITHAIYKALNLEFEEMNEEDLKRNIKKIKDEITSRGDELFKQMNKEMARIHGESSSEVDKMLSNAGYTPIEIQLTKTCGFVMKEICRVIAMVEKTNENMVMVQDIAIENKMALNDLNGTDMVN